jgi:uncharacterized membrane protein YkoI
MGARKEPWEMPTFDRRALLFAAVSCLAAGHVARADSVDEQGRSIADRGNHDEARRAFQQGHIRSLSEIMAGLRPELGGEVIEVELKKKRGIYYYKFKILAANGRLGEISVDATTGKVIERE